MTTPDGYSVLLIVWAVIPFFAAMFTARGFKPSIDSRFFAHLVTWYFLWLSASLYLAFYLGAV